MGNSCSARKPFLATSIANDFLYTFSRKPLPSVLCTLYAHPIIISVNSSSPHNPLFLNPVNLVNPV